MVQGLVNDEVRSSASVVRFEKHALDIESNSIVDGITNPANKRKLYFNANQQIDDFEGSKKKSPLGLNLTITTSFQNQVDVVLSRARTKHGPNHALTRVGGVEEPYSIPQLQHHEKLKASNFPASWLIIGTYKRSSIYKGDLIAKSYYAKRKLVWEILEGPVKSKIEIQWSDIEAIRKTIHENGQDILEIELNQQPIFYKETNPQPKKHTIWQTSSDFTAGQALICRRHRIGFPPGVLDKHYEKLLQSDLRLLELSRKPFPKGKSPYFYQKPYHCNDIISSHLPSFSSLAFPCPDPYDSLNLITNSSSQVAGTNFRQGHGDAESYRYAIQGESTPNFNLVQDQFQGLQMPTTQGSFEGYNLNNSQLIHNESNSQSMHGGNNSLPHSSKINMASNQLEYIQDNFDVDSSLLVQSENFDFNDGMICPLPINQITSQVPSDNLVLENCYPSEFYDSSEGDYGVVGKSYLGPLWS